MYETSQGKLFVDISGTGHPVLFFHGGPGLSHAYMRPYFDPLTARYTAIFFDQLSCGQSDASTEITDNNTVSSAAELIEQLGLKDRQYSVIAHSWGAYVVAALLHKGLLKNKPAKIIFLNPTPFKTSLYKDVGRRLISRIPDDVAGKIGTLVSLNTDASGAELMQTALPYYSGKQENLPLLDLHYRMKTYSSVAASLQDFDFTETIRAIKHDCHFIFGQNDYISPDDFSDVFGLDDKVSYDCVEGGHFAFAEETQHIINIIEKILLHEI